MKIIMSSYEFIRYCEKLGILYQQEGNFIIVDDLTTGWYNVIGKRESVNSTTVIVNKEFYLSTYKEVEDDK